jgi:hypothetical protein
MTEISQLARGREIGGGGSSLGYFPEGEDRIRCACAALQDALAVLLEEEGGPRHPRARIRGPRLRTPPSRPRGDDEQAQAVRRRCEGGVRRGREGEAAREVGLRRSLRGGARGTVAVELTASHAEQGCGRLGRLPSNEKNAVLDRKVSRENWCTTRHGRRARLEEKSYRFFFSGPFFLE